MKKIILVCLSLLLLSGCNERNLPEEEIIEDNFITKDFTLNLTKIVGCTNQVKEYYNYQDRTVHFVCIDEIYLKRKNTKDMTLKYHFQNVNQSFDTSIKEIVSDIDDIEYLKDGGTKIYKHNEYTIIVCNTLDGNTDIYFGTPSLEYNQEYCK